jgi:hypothetical protein
MHYLVIVYLYTVVSIFLLFNTFNASVHVHDLDLYLSMFLT